MTNKKILILGMIMLLAGTLFLGAASAKEYTLVCLDRGETVHWSLCNTKMTDYTCPKEQCSACAYISESTGNLCPASLSECNALGLTCGGYGGGDGNTTIDAVPPEFSIISPTEGTISSSRKLYLNFTLNELADVYYRDLNKGVESWIKVCDDCSPGNPSYAKLRTFAEGENDLMFKAEDYYGNAAYANVKFTTDSLKPRIYRTYPMANKFADGTFEVQFKEANPTRLTLHYGTDTANVDLDNDCYAGMGKTICTIDVGLSKYNDQQIEYYFDIEDIAGNTYKSRATKVNVDTVAPAVNNPDSFYTLNGRYANFNIDITEKNFYKVTFVDQKDPRLLEKTLCTRLVFGDCIRRQSLTAGEHLLSIQITDKAGLSTSLSAGPFTITY